MKKMERIFLGEYDGRDYTQKVEKTYSDVSGKELSADEVFHVNGKDCDYGEALMLLGATILSDGMHRCELCSDTLEAEAFEIYRVDEALICESCIYDYVCDNYKVKP